jgi:hypothetical protein
MRTSTECTPTIPRAKEVAERKKAEAAAEEAPEPTPAL